MKTKCPLCKHVFEVTKVAGKAVSCPQCQTNFRATSKHIPQKIALLILIILIGVFITIGMKAEKVNISKKMSWKGSTKTRRKSVLVHKPKKVSFENIDTVYEAAVKNNKLKPGQVRPEDIGKTVVWRGALVKVGISQKHNKVYAKFKHKASSKSNVTVYFLDETIPKIKMLKPGAFVTYSGVMVTSAYNGKDHILKSGRIIHID
ncbi:MAG: hypothetical protein KAJ07_10905 [Planctomycetes bacterium]|nr:hypothetical protein [Planctomycetota bacterium]